MPISKECQPPNSLKKLPKNFKDIYRIIDANANRVREGLRVCEEITRFILNKYSLTSEIKKIRHNLKTVLNKLPTDKFFLLKSRDSIKDVGKYISAREYERENFQDIFFANIQRVKESVRVLEEFSKLIDKDIAKKLKIIRYGIYDFEKKVSKNF